jgi:hypothetical protein
MYINAGSETWEDILVISKSAWEDNIKMDLEAIEWEGVDCINLAQGGDQEDGRRKPLRSLQGEEFIDYLNNYWLLKKGCVLRGGS